MPCAQPKSRTLAFAAVGESQEPVQRGGTHGWCDRLLPGTLPGIFCTAHQPKRKSERPSPTPWPRAQTQSRHRSTHRTSRCTPTNTPGSRLRLPAPSQRLPSLLCPRGSSRLLRGPPGAWQRPLRPSWPPARAAIKPSQRGKQRGTLRAPLWQAYLCSFLLFPLRFLRQQLCCRGRVGERELFQVLVRGVRQVLLAAARQR